MSLHSAPPPPHRPQPLADLLPWRAWVHDRRLRTPAVGLFAALVTVPSVGSLIGDDDVDTGLVVFALYFAVAWFLLLRAIIRPEQVSSADIAQVVVLALVLQKPLIFGWYDMVGDIDFENLLATTFGNGLPEELLKLLPVAVVAFVHHRSWSRRPPRDYLFLGLVSGLAFGTGEAITYVTVNYSSAVDPIHFIWRLVDGPIGHACWAGISAYFLGLAMTRSPGRRAALIALGLAIPAVLHGLNNWSPVNGSIGWVAIALISGLLVLGYATIGVDSAPSLINPEALPMSASSDPRAEQVLAAVDPVTERFAVPGTTATSFHAEQPVPAGAFRGPDGRLWG